MSEIIHPGFNIVFWEEGGVFVIASAFTSFILKLDMVTSIFLNIFVQDFRIPGFNSVYRYETGVYLVSDHLPQLHLQFCCSLLHRVSSPYRLRGCHCDSTTRKNIYLVEKNDIIINYNLTVVLFILLAFNWISTKFVLSVYQQNLRINNACMQHVES